MLAEWQGAGDTEMRWRQRLMDVPFNLIAYLDDAPAGIASGTAVTADGSVELISMWVAPFARGRGVGDKLIDGVIQWAREQHAKRVLLAVVPANAQAIALYRRHGFRDAGVVDGELTMQLALAPA
jgi:ribosomal protein S18 acetylase RimI-like enzyme